LIFWLRLEFDLEREKERDVSFFLFLSTFLGVLFLVLSVCENNAS